MNQLETIRFPRRQQILDSFQAGLLEKIDLALPGRFTAGSHEIAAIVPHPRLRLVLESDPVMAAILPCSTRRFSLGSADGPPFRLRDGLVQLSPSLLDDPSAMAAAARWGLEAALLLDAVPPTRRHVLELLHHGARLLAMLSCTSRDLFLSLLPDTLGTS